MAQIIVFLKKTSLLTGNVKHVTPDQRVMVDDKAGHLKFVKPLQNVKCDDLYGNSKFVRPKQHVKVDDGILSFNPHWKPQFGWSSKNMLPKLPAIGTR